MHKVEAKLARSYFTRVAIVGGLFVFFGLVIGNFGFKYHLWPALLFAVAINVIWIALFWREYRRGPALLDTGGVTRRDGARFEWKDLIAVVDVTHKTIPSYTSVRFPKGEVRLFPLTLENAADVVRFVDLKRRQKGCAVCTTLPDYCHAIQKHGRKGESTNLPYKAHLLKWVKATESGKNRSRALMQCPFCASYYLHEIGREYPATSIEEEQKLTRLSDEEAAKYL